MKAMRKCNDEIYQLAKDQALVKKLKNKRFRSFCLCLSDVMFVTRGSKNSLFFVFDFLSNLDYIYIYVPYKIIYMHQRGCRDRMVVTDQLDFKLPLQSVPITTNIVSLNNLGRDVLDTALCDKFCHCLVTGRWFSLRYS